jgi:mannitol-specific phosphotransferase system IIBC component
MAMGISGTVAAAAGGVLIGVAAESSGNDHVTITTIIVAAIVQITLAFFAFMLAVKANAKADKAAVVNDATHKIVNQQRTDMKKELDDSKKEIADMKLEVAHLKETILVERTMAAAPALDPPAAITPLNPPKKEPQP